ncbi:MAG: hypothetical protein WCA78_03215 [Rhizomicrobium sp.]
MSIPRIAKPTVFLALVILLNGIGSVDAAVFCQRPACLLAHDINGIRLDMTVQQVSEFFDAGLRPLGSGQFKAERDGTSYDFGFTPLGHLFRIDSSQTLSRFEPDVNIGLALTQKLVKKYGPPDTNQLPGGPAFWQFVEYYDNSGFRTARDTETLSAVFTTRYQAPSIS